MTTKPRLMVISAHPDDSEMRAGALTKRWVDAGGEALWMSMTDGSMGHQELAGAKLTAHRWAESQTAAALVGAESIYLDNQDGSLMPSIEVRNQVIRRVREFAPDVIATHRPYDYHPDHRYTGQIVQDACYMMQVPNVVPHAPVMRKFPVVLNGYDVFKRPVAHRADLVLDIDDIVELKAQLIGSHAIQVYDWLPWQFDYTDQVPADVEKDGYAFLRERWLEPVLGVSADPVREQLIARYGSERGAAVHSVEVFEVSEYGAQLTPELEARLFPF